MNGVQNASSDKKVSNLKQVSTFSVDKLPEYLNIWNSRIGWPVLSILDS